MSKLVVEVDDFVDAARSMRGEVAENLQLCVSGITGRLQSELVGVDPAGVAWASDYDAAARSVLAASAQLASAAFRTAQLFAASGHNYATAEAASTTGGGSLDGDWSALLTDPPVVRAPVVPSAGGAGHDTPAGWWLIAHTVGYLWPGGHQDRLHNTADTWRSAARSLDNAAGVPLAITTSFLRDGLPEADGIRRVCTNLYRQLTDLTAGHRALADTCDAYAAHLDHCHTAIRDELSDLVAESVALQAGGAALSVITLGAAEIPTQAAQAARITLAATRIGRIIDKLITAAKTLANGIARIRQLANDIHTALEELNTTRIAYAGITHVPRLERAAMKAKDGRAAERAARAERADETATTDLARSKPFTMTKNDREHILGGNNGGGGHRWPGEPGKTPFPQHWTDDQIITNVEDIVNSPATKWHAQNGSGGAYMRSGQPATWRAWEVRDGIRIRVAFEPATGRIFTAFPDNAAAIGKVVS